MPIDIENEKRGSDRSAVIADSSCGTDRLRILHVVPHLAMGGTENGILKVINGLGETEFEHRICAVRGIDASFASRASVTPRAYSAASSKQGFQFPLFRLSRIMKGFQPHIVHSRNFGALEAIPAARLARVPVAIHSEHGYELETLAGLPLRRRILCRAFYGMADAVFTVTNDLKTYHAKESGLAANEFRVIYNGVNTERFAPRPDSAERIRRELGIPEGRVVIGSVGRLVPIKDHLTLLRALEVLLRQGEDVHVLLVGSGPELSKLKEHVLATPDLFEKVTFVGSSDQVPELLNAMDIFVLPSISEGMSNTILEAMASGLPVVITNTGGSPELIEDGRSGWLFSPRDVNTLAWQLARLAADKELRLQFGAAARQHALEQFSLTRMMQRYRDLYFELATRRKVWKRN